MSGISIQDALAICQQEGKPKAYCTVLRACQKGAIKPAKINQWGRWEFSPESLMDWLINGLHRDKKQTL